MRRRNAALRNGVTACCARCSAACLICSSVGSPLTPGSCLAASICASGSQALQQVVRQVGEGLAAGKLLQLAELRRREVALQAGQASGKRGERVGVGAALRDVFEQLLQRGGRLAVERVRVGLVLLADADGVDDDEPLLGLGAGRDRRAACPAR